jgi:hypothetical protein
MKNGFRESGIRMNQYIAQKENWSLPELEERSQLLMSRSLEIWAIPATEYKPEVKQLDTYTLDDDANLNGRSIVRFSYKNTEQPVISWIDMFVRVLKILHTEDKSVLSKMANTNADNMGGSPYVSDQKDTHRDYFEIENGLYVEKNTSTWTKISLLRRLFMLYSIDPSDLVFYLRDENESDEEELAGTRYELRKRYWAYALEFIQRAHEMDGAFTNVNPSKSNWINGYFGISGFAICCIANFDEARVELWLGRSLEENKAAFDHLMMHRAEIEESLGIALTWERGKEIKSSKIYCQLDNVGINNETDWLQMANFHAEWSKKFFVVLVPFLKELF